MSLTLYLSRKPRVLIRPFTQSLRDDDLAYLMAINTKDLHKICGKLREDRFLTVYVSHVAKLCHYFVICSLWLTKADTPGRNCARVTRVPAIAHGTISTTDIPSMLSSGEFTPSIRKFRARRCQRTRKRNTSATFARPSGLQWKSWTALGRTASCVIGVTILSHSRQTELPLAMSSPLG